LYKTKQKYNKSGIYKIINLINEKTYIGSAVNLKTRKYTHFYKLKEGKHSNVFLQNSFNKYGISNFQFEILEFCDKSVLLVREQYWIDRFFDNQVMCFNINKTAGSWLGRKHSEKSKKKMSILHKGKNKSETTKKKMSISHKGLKQSEETKAKISTSSRNRQSNPKMCPQWNKTGKLSAHKRKTKVIFEDGSCKIFDTVKETAIFTNVNQSTITRAIKSRNGKVKNFTFSFVDKSKAYKRKNTFGRKNKNAKMVSVTNTETNKNKIFSTVKEAAKFIGSPASSVSRSLHSNNKIRNFVVEILL